MKKQILHVSKSSLGISIIEKKKHNLLGHNQSCFKYNKNVLQNTEQMKTYNESGRATSRILVLFCVPPSLAHCDFL